MPNPEAPSIILVKPQLAENIGTAARAMYNGGLMDLRLVDPKGGWPNPKAVNPAAGATCVLDTARAYPTTAAAIADIHVLYATTARHREIIKTVLTPRQAAQDMRAHIQEGRRVGILFGPERTGLHNDDVTFASASICVPLNPAYTSLNLAQAVLIIAYEWMQLSLQAPDVRFEKGHTEMANREELADLFNHLESALDASGFLRVKHKRPVMVQNIRNMFSRIPLTSQEVRTMRGIIASLTTPYYKHDKDDKSEETV